MVYAAQPKAVIGRHNVLSEWFEQDCLCPRCSTDSTMTLQTREERETLLTECYNLIEPRSTGESHTEVECMDRLERGLAHLKESYRPSRLGDQLPSCLENESFPELLPECLALIEDLALPPIEHSLLYQKLAQLRAQESLRQGARMASCRQRALLAVDAAKNSLEAAGCFLLPPVSTPVTMLRECCYTMMFLSVMYHLTDDMANSRLWSAEAKRLYGSISGTEEQIFEKLWPRNLGLSLDQ